MVQAGEAVTAGGDAPTGSSGSGSSGTGRRRFAALRRGAARLRPGRPGSSGEPPAGRRSWFDPRRGWITAGLAVAVTVLLALHSAVPNRWGNLGSLDRKSVV